MMILFLLFATAFLIAAAMWPVTEREPIFRNAEWRNGRDPVFIKRIGQDYMDAVYGKAVSIK